MASDLSSTLTGPASQHAVSGAYFDAVKVYCKNKNGKTSLCSLLFLALCMLYTKYCVPVSHNANPPKWNTLKLWLFHTANSQRFVVVYSSSTMRLAALLWASLRAGLLRQIPFGDAGTL
jgi:hypothetical protein